MDRIVYGIPFTSIIDQTAAIFPACPPSDTERRRMQMRCGLALREAPSMMVQLAILSRGRSLPLTGSEFPATCFHTGTFGRRPGTTIVPGGWKQAELMPKSSEPKRPPCVTDSAQLSTIMCLSGPSRALRLCGGHGSPDLMPRADV
jgi:hypothetical protein